MIRAAQRVSLMAAIWLLAQMPAAAQCVLCYKTVEGAGTRTIEVIKVGILIMLIPTLFIFGLVALMIYRRRKTPGGDAAQLPEFPADALDPLSSPTHSPSR